jgi:hypothetical protein
VSSAAGSRYDDRYDANRAALLSYRYLVTNETAQSEFDINFEEILIAVRATLKPAATFAKALGLAGDPERRFALLPDTVALLHNVTGHFLHQAKLHAEAKRAFSNAIAQRREILAAELRATLGIAEFQRNVRIRGALADRLKVLFQQVCGAFDLPDLEDARAFISAVE